MKASSVSLSLLTATLFALPALAQSEKAEEPASAPAMTQRQQDLIQRFDKNGDGRLDEDEKAAAHAEMRREGKGEGERGGRAEMRKKLLKRFDKNGDGKLNEAERAEAEKAVKQFKERRDEFLKRFDKDGDGTLNDEERAAAEKARQEFIEKIDRRRAKQKL
jgi:Ca2+-binding EF-hand superfamily protein